MEEDVTPDRIRESFSAQGMLQTLGARLLRASNGLCVIEAPISSAASQQQGYAHAGLTFAIGDSAAGYVALSLMPEDMEVLTVEMKINLLAPARDGPLRAEGQVIRAGRRLTVVRSRVLERETEVAILQGTMIPVPI